jgi:NAD(P)-dependent dehydrogenase (short-subunit alcohol dehydrogenase family)
LKLLNKVVLIAGASSGIGYATALLFAKEEARVVVTRLLAQQIATATNAKGVANK